MQNVAGMADTWQIHDVPKTVFFILLDLALCVGACLNPLSRTPHYKTCLQREFKQVPIISAKSSNSENPLFQAPCISVKKMTGSGKKIWVYESFSVCKGFSNKKTLLNRTDSISSLKQIMQLQFARNDLCERKCKSKIDFFSAEQNIIEISEK